MRDTELYYGLVPYRNNEPQSIVIAMRHEIFRPLQLLHGVTEALDIHIKKAENAPPTIAIIQKELAQAHNSIYSLLVDFSEHKILDFDNPIIALRDQMLPFITQAQNASKKLRTAENALASQTKDGHLWIEYAERATHEIWVITDALTNPNLELPKYLSQWLSMRDDLNFQAKQGNMQITDTLISALDYPEPKIRIDSLICLGHLKNAQTVPFISKLLHDEFHEVTVWAVESLKKIGGLEAEQALKTYYDSQNNLSE